MSARAVRSSSCSLCGDEQDLCESHIFPKFVIRWLKETSGTGRLRQLDNPRKRKQDGPKEKLLCRDCEQLLSDDERWFASAVFRPTMSGEEPELLGSELTRFAIGLSWRVLITDGERLAGRYPRFRRRINRTCGEWGRALLDRTPVGRHYLFPLPDQMFVIDSDANLNWYLHRAIDGTALLVGSRPFIWWKIPGFAGLSAIGGNGLGSDSDFLLEDAGMAGNPWRGASWSATIDSLLISRAGESHTQLYETLTDADWQRINADYAKSADWLTSAAADVARADGLVPDRTAE